MKDYWTEWYEKHRDAEWVIDGPFQRSESFSPFWNVALAGSSKVGEYVVICDVRSQELAEMITSEHNGRPSEETTP